MSLILVPKSNNFTGVEITQFASVSEYLFRTSNAIIFPTVCTFLRTQLGSCLKRNENFCWLLPSGILSEQRAFAAAPFG